MDKYSHSLIEKTIEVWQPHFPVSLTVDDAIEIIENTTNLMKLLFELDEKYAQKK